MPGGGTVPVSVGVPEVAIETLSMLDVYTGMDSPSIIVFFVETVTAIPPEDSGAGRAMISMNDPLILGISDDAASMAVATDVVRVDS